MGPLPSAAAAAALAAPVVPDAGGLPSIAEEEAAAGSADSRIKTFTFEEIRDGSPESDFEVEFESSIGDSEDFPSFTCSRKALVDAIESNYPEGVRFKLDNETDYHEEIDSIPLFCGYRCVVEVKVEDDKVTLEMHYFSFEDDCHLEDDFNKSLEEEEEEKDDHGNWVTTRTITREGKINGEACTFSVRMRKIEGTVFKDDLSDSYSYEVDNEDSLSILVDGEKNEQYSRIFTVKNEYEGCVENNFYISCDLEPTDSDSTDSEPT